MSKTHPEDRLGVSVPFFITVHQSLKKLYGNRMIDQRFFSLLAELENTYRTADKPAKEKQPCPSA